MKDRYSYVAVFEYGEDVFQSNFQIYQDVIRVQIRMIPKGL